MGSATKSASSFIARLQARSGFIVSVYSLLTAQLAVMAVIVYALRERPDVRTQLMRYFWGWFVAFIIVAIVLIVSSIRKWSKWTRLTLFTLFSLLAGLMSRAAADRVPDALIERALIGTAASFVAMTVLAVGLAAAGFDMAPMGFFLGAILLGLVVSRIILLITGATKQTWQILYTVGIVLFSLFIAYDTNIMLQVGYDRDVIDTALGFYLDIINLFQDLLNLAILDS